MANKKIQLLSPIRRGDTKSWELNFKDKSDNVLDITGHQITFAIKEDIRDPNSKAIILETQTAGDNSLDDPINGKMFFNLNASQTSKLSIQTYQIGVSRSITSPPENIITTFFATEVEVLPDVFRN